MYSLFKLIFILLSLSAIGTAITNNFIVVPAGHVAVLKEQTLGWQKPYLKPGRHWLWSGFVPDKWKIYVINLQPNTLEIDFKKGLEYTDYLSLTDSFRLQLRFRLRYQFEEAAIENLLINFSENINDWQSLIISRVNTLLELKFFEFYESEDDIPSLAVDFTNYLQNNSQDSFQDDWQKSFVNDKIILKKVELEKVFSPNKAIYLEQVQNVDEIFSARRTAQVHRILAAADIDKQEKLNLLEIEKTKQFSVLLKENPAITQFYKIEKLNPRAKVIIIENNDNSTSTNLHSQELIKEEIKEKNENDEKKTEMPEKKEEE